MDAIEDASAESSDLDVQGALDKCLYELNGVAERRARAIWDKSSQGLKPRSK